MKEVSLVIIGGGSAGMAAAIEAKKNGVDDILILEKDNDLGGILNQCIHNGFGLTEFKEELTGPEFMTRLSDQVEQLKIDYVLNTTVTSLLPDKTIYASNKDGFFIIKAKAVLVTTGCYERNAGAIMLPGERPSGVVTAGTAQLYLNIYGYLVGKKVFILGSGDIGLIMARRLTLEGAKVLGVAELCPYSNGLNRNIVQCLKDFNIPLYLSHTVSNVSGKDGILKSVTISQVDEHNEIIPNTGKTYECDTLLLSVGLIPNTPLLRDAGAKLTRSKGAEVNERYETSLPGVFSAGNVLHVHDLVDLVTKESRLVAHYIKEYLDGKSSDNQYLNVIAGDGVGYVLPHKVSLNNTHDVTFKFRVRKPIKDLNVIFLDKDQEIKRIFKSVLIPSEMTEINLTLDELKKFKNNITVKVEKKI